MDTDTKPLTARAEAFARAYAGDGVAAARIAGYTGGAAGLAVTASRLLKDARVAAILAERREADRARVAATRPEPSPVEPPEEPRHARINVAAALNNAVASGLDPIAVLEEIAGGGDVHPSSRVAAAKALERHQRETNAGAADPFAELRATVADIIRAKRAREREEEE